MRSHDRSSLAPARPPPPGTSARQPPAPRAAAVPPRLPADPGLDRRGARARTCGWPSPRSRPGGRAQGRRTTIFPENPSLAGLRPAADRDRIPQVSRSTAPSSPAARGGDVVFCSLLAGNGPVPLPLPRSAGGALRHPAGPAVPDDPAASCRCTSSSRACGLLDNKIGLVLVYSAFAMSFSTWLMKGFVDQIPVRDRGGVAHRRLLRVRQAFIYVILPLSRAGHRRCWHVRVHLLLERVPVRPHLHVQRRARRRSRWVCSQFIGENIIRWDFLTSGGVLAAIPILIGFMFAQRGLVEGLASGAVKG